MTRPITTEAAVALVLSDPVRSPFPLTPTIALAVAETACRVFRSTAEYRALLTEQVRFEAERDRIDAALIVAAALAQPTLSEEMS